MASESKNDTIRKSTSREDGLVARLRALADTFRDDHGRLVVASVSSVEACALLEEAVECVLAVKTEHASQIGYFGVLLGRLDSHASVAEVDALIQAREKQRAELYDAVRRFQEREAYWTKVLDVADKGQYRADWDSRIRAVVDARDKALGQVEQLTTELAVARDALDRDRTGLAAALDGIVKTCDSYQWATEGRGPYEWDDDRYKEEFRNALISIRVPAIKALEASGTIASETLMQTPSPRLQNITLQAKLSVAELATEQQAAVVEAQAREIAEMRARHAALENEVATLRQRNAQAEEEFQSDYERGVEHGIKSALDRCSGVLREFQVEEEERVRSRVPVSLFFQRMNSDFRGAKAVVELCTTRIAGLLQDESGVPKTRWLPNATRSYLTDDRDIDADQHRLDVFHGENGDWYVTIMPNKDRYSRACVRVTTSGTHYPRMPSAMRALWEALGESVHKPRATKYQDP